MSTLHDVIVGFWFIPVTLFIIIPLLMLSGYGVYKGVMSLTSRKDSEKERDQEEADNFFKKVISRRQANWGAAQ